MRVMKRSKGKDGEEKKSQKAKVPQPHQKQDRTAQDVSVQSGPNF